MAKFLCLYFLGNNQRRTRLKFFIDTANLDEIKQAADYGILAGVTTNPSLMAKVGVKGRENILEHYRQICEIVDDNVNAEVISTDYEGMLAEAQTLSGLSPKIIVKIPMTRDGIRAITHLSHNNIRTNCTLVFSAGQALLAANAGASFVSPFIGRLDDISSNGLGLLGELVTIYDNYGYQTQILAASIRNPLHIIESAKIGVDVATCPLSTIEQLFDHPLTNIGLVNFLKDYEESQK